MINVSLTQADPEGVPKRIQGVDGKAQWVWARLTLGQRGLNEASNSPQS
jgi:hypothetical protein